MEERRLSQTLYQKHDYNSTPEGIRNTIKKRKFYTLKYMMEHEYKFAPKSTKDKQIMPWNPKTNDYSLDNYHLGKFDNVVKVTCIDEVIESLFTKNMLSLENHVRKWNYSNIFMITQLIILQSQTEVWMFFISDAGSSYEVVLYFVLPILIGVISAIWYFTYKLIFKKKLKKMQRKRIVEINRKLSQWNNEKFENVGLLWKCSENCGWLELKQQPRHRISLTNTDRTYISFTEKDDEDYQVKSSHSIASNAKSSKSKVRQADTRKNTLNSKKLPRGRLNKFNNLPQHRNTNQDNSKDNGQDFSNQKYTSLSL